MLKKGNMEARGIWKLNKTKWEKEKVTNQVKGNWKHPFLLQKSLQLPIVENKEARSLHQNCEYAGMIQKLKKP